MEVVVVVEMVTAWDSEAVVVAEVVVEVVNLAMDKIEDAEEDSVVVVADHLKVISLYQKFCGFNSFLKNENP